MNVFRRVLMIAIDIFLSIYGFRKVNLLFIKFQLIGQK